MRVLVALLTVIAVAPGCRRQRPNTKSVELADGGEFDVPATAVRSDHAKKPNERSFVVAKDTVLEVATEPMTEDCQSRLTWVEQQTASQVDGETMKLEHPLTRMTLGGRQAVYARMVTVPGPKNQVQFLRTEMYGMCGDGSFVIFQLSYLTKFDEARSAVLRAAAKSLRY